MNNQPKDNFLKAYFIIAFLIPIVAVMLVTFDIGRDYVNGSCPHHCCCSCGI